MVHAHDVTLIFRRRSFYPHVPYWYAERMGWVSKWELDNARRPD